MNGKNNLTGINKWEFVHAAAFPCRPSPARCLSETSCWSSKVCPCSWTSLLLRFPRDTAAPDMVPQPRAALAVYALQGLLLMHGKTRSPGASSYGAAGGSVRGGWAQRARSPRSSLCSLCSHPPSQAAPWGVSRYQRQVNEISKSFSICRMTFHYLVRDYHAVHS